MRTFLLVLAVFAALVCIDGCKPAQRPAATADGAASTAGQAGEVRSDAPEPPAVALSTAEIKAAIASAAAEKRYAFLTFYDGQDAAGAAMRRQVEAIVNGKLAGRARFVGIDVAGQGNAALKIKYGAATDGALPMTVVVAPNGAITASFAQAIPAEVVASAFDMAFTSPLMADVLLALQQGKLAAICVQGPKTQHNAASLAAARGFAANPNFSAGTIVVFMLDPADKAEARLLRVCRIEPDTTTAYLVVIGAHGEVIGKFAGDVTEQEVVKVVGQALGGTG